MSDKLESHFCQETHGYNPHHTDGTDGYLRCNAPAGFLVKPTGRDEGPYWMCYRCASHNISNRNCQDVTPTEYRRLQTTEVRVGSMWGTYKIYVMDLCKVFKLLSEMEQR